MGTGKVLYFSVIRVISAKTGAYNFLRDLMRGAVTYLGSRSVVSSGSLHEGHGGDSHQTPVDPKP